MALAGQRGEVARTEQLQPPIAAATMGLLLDVQISSPPAFIRFLHQHTLVPRTVSRYAVTLSGCTTLLEKY